jgi:hypothetical protein
MLANFSLTDLVNVLTVISIVVIGVVAVIAMVNERYKDTFIQCVGLSLVTGMSAILLLQYVTIGQPSQNAYGVTLLGVAIYGVGTVIKHMRYQRRSRNQKRRLYDA